MTTEPPPEAEARTPAPEPRRRGVRAGQVALWTGIAVITVLVLAIFAALAIDTGGGRALIVRVIQNQKQASGLTVRIGRIDGSIYGRMVIHDLAIGDTRGVFATSPAVTVDWRPGALANKHLLFRELSADTVHVLRAPALKPTPPKPNQPVIPDIYLTVQQLRVGVLVLEPALTGDRRSVGLQGSVELMHGRAQADLQALAQMIDGHAGGDRAAVKLDAEPAKNRLVLDAHLKAPQGGVVDRLAKLGAPLAVDIGGRGDWAKWDGRATASLGGQSLLLADVAARSGQVTIRGQSQPGLVVKGPPAALTAPALAFDLSGRLENRQLDGRANLSSSAFTVAATGRLDLARSRYVGVKVEGRLTRPEAAAPKLHGRDIHASLALEGPFARPLVDYDAQAARIGFDQTSLEGVHASGKARVDAEGTLRLPVHATAVRIIGVPEAVGGLVTNARVDGDFVISSKQIASDNLRLRSDRMDATVVLALSLQTGRYDAVLKGRVNRYAVRGLGLVDVVTDAKLIPTGRGEFRIAGHVHGQTLRLDNPGIAQFLGGNAVVDADFSRSAQGVFGVANLRLTAPKFRVLNGGGTYAVNGRINFTANAVSDAYGAARLDVSGTAAKPEARLRSAAPKVGGLMNLDVRLKGTGPNRYDVTLAANSPYGPIAADLGLGLGQGAMTADVRKASLDGIAVAGQVRQTAAGPFAGTLNITGPGLTGTARLAAEGKLQRADIALAAANARLPLMPPVTVARGRVNATAVLYPTAPTVTANIDLAGVRQGGLVVDAARAKVDYRNGTGQVELSANGRSGAPFSLATNASITPDLIRVSGQGTVKGVTARLAAPAEIRREKDGYRLAPATILLPQGQVDVSGAFGKATQLQARLQNLDLGLADAFVPDLGLNGKASGVLDFNLPAGGAAPAGKAQLQVQGFTRSSLTTVSEPVDLALVGDLSQAGGNASAIVRRRGAVIGRLQARLTPNPASAGQPWMQRLMAAPLSGGLRYNGPAEALWALSGVGGQEVAGPIAIGADFSGRVDAPQITGVVKAQSLRYENTSFGTVIDQIAIDGRFADTRFELSKMTARAGRGTIQASGYADLSAAKGFPIDIKLAMANATLARSNTVDANVTGSIAVTNSKDMGALVSGEVTVNNADYQVARQGAADLVELTGVRRKGEPIQTAAAKQAAAAGPPSVWKLNVTVHAPSQLFVRGMGLDAEWGSELKITGDAAHPVVVGDITLVRGRFSFAGKDLTLSRGVIHLNGSNPPNPTLDIQGSTTVESVTANINIGGTALSPEITFSSTPALPQDEILSRLLFGSSVTSLSPLQAVQLAAALNSLRGSGGGLNPLGKLRQAAGLDQLRFYGADQATGRGPAVGAGRYIGKNLYVEVTTDARGYTATQIEIALSRTLRLLSQVSSLGSSNVRLRYSHDY